MSEITFIVNFFFSHLISKPYIADALSREVDLSSGWLLKRGLSVCIYTPNRVTDH